MPKSSPAKLAYQAKYNARPEMVNRREDNNLARAQMLRAGKVHKGDGKDVAHKKALDNGGLTSAKNLEVETAKKNRGWRKTAAYKVPNIK